MSIDITTIIILCILYFVIVLTMTITQPIPGFYIALLWAMWVPLFICGIFIVEFFKEI